MNRDGEIIAILNENQVLVRLETEGRFDVGAEFTAFEEHDLPEAITEKEGIGRVQIPKGKLRLEAVQENALFAVMSIWQGMAWKRIRTPSAIEQSLMKLSGGREEEVQVPIGKRANLDLENQLGLRSDKIKPGDSVGHD